MRVYAKIRSCLQLFFVLSTLFLATGCVTGYSLPWGANVNTGVVTDNPDSIPDISWQTQNQRQELIAQNNAIAAQPPAAAPASPEAAAATTETAPAPEAVGPAPRKIAVSILLPLSGKKADLGQSMLKAAQMALFDIGSANFELVPRDTKSTPEGAAAAAKAAVAANTDLILGPVFADDLRAVKPIAAAVHIPVVSFTTDWTLAGDDTYILGFLPFAQVARVAKYAESKGYSRFSVYAPETEYCNVVINTLQSSGVNIVHTNRYSPQQSDLSVLVKEFADAHRDKTDPAKFDFDALMLPMGSEGLRSLVTFLDVNKVTQDTVKFIGTGLWDDVALTTNPLLHGGWFAAPDPILRADFEKRFQENYGATPARLASLAYDATALAAVLARTSQSADAVSPYSSANMTNPRGFAGIDGIFRFRPDGLSERGLAVLEIQSGRSKVIDKAPTAFIPSGS